MTLETLENNYSLLHVYLIMGKNATSLFQIFYGFNTLTSCSKQTTGTAQSFVLLSYYTTRPSQNCTNKQCVGRGVEKRKKRKEGRKICWGQKIKTLKCPWIL